MPIVKPPENSVVLLAKPTPKSYETLNSYFHICAAVYVGSKIGSRMLRPLLPSFLPLRHTTCNCLPGVSPGLGTGLLAMELEVPPLFLDSRILVLNLVVFMCVFVNKKGSRKTLFCF